MKNHRLMALSPADTIDGLDLMVDNVGGDETRCFFVAIVIEVELSIDVQSGGSTAWRPYTSLIGNSITEGEAVRVLSLPVTLKGCLFIHETSEPILGLLSGIDSFLDLTITFVVGLVQGVLVSVGVVKLDVDVAVLASLGKGDTGADGCDIAVECEGDCLPIVGLADSDCSCFATATSIGDPLDVNLAGVDIITIGSGCCGAEDGEEAENKGRNGVLHSDGLIERKKRR